MPDGYREVQHDPARRRGLWSFALLFVIGFSLAGGLSVALRGGNRPPPAADPGTAAVDGQPDTAAADVPADTAEQTVTVAAKPDPAGAAARFRRGFEHFRRERFGQAFREFTKAIELDPTAPEPHVGMGKAYEALDYFQRAEQAYRKAIELDPKYHGARVALAKLLCDFGKNRESLDLLTDAQKTNQRDPLVWAEIAVNEIRLGNPQVAIPLLQKYNRHDPNQDWGHVHLGRAYAGLKDHKAAEEAYRRGLAIDPNSELGNKWLADLLRDTGRGRQAEPFFKRFREMRQLQTEERQLEQAVARRPGNLKARVALLVKLAEARQRLGQSRQALVPLRNALELMPGEPQLQRLYAEQLRRAGVRPPR